jgi:hypothetical protein
VIDLLQFGPFISEREIERVIPTIQELLVNKPPNLAHGSFSTKSINLQLKAFSESTSREYANERECIMELQSTESVPILVAYDDEELFFVLDLVHGEDLSTHCREQGISINSFEGELLTSLQSMLSKGWYLPIQDFNNVIWCEDCDALFIVDYNGCEKVHNKDIIFHKHLIIENTKALFKQ